MMLVLSRKRDEKVCIGDNIVITIVDIRGDRVRVGIEAPADIRVHRQEIYEALQKEATKKETERKETAQKQGHTLSNKACPACGDLDGCHLQLQYEQPEPGKGE